MTKEEIEYFINQLRESISKDDALFEIRKEGPSPQDGFVIANKDGIISTAAELLQASLYFDTAIQNSNTAIPFSTNELQSDGELVIGYIEATLAKRKRTPVKEPAKETWKDKVMKVGCLMGFVLLIVSIIVGFITLVKWIF